MARRCVNCKKFIEDRDGRLLCPKCGVLSFRLQAVAHRHVRNAIGRGDLTHPKFLTCVDCSKPAKCYDHRDYSKPLQVEPVCGSCNVKRGPAIPLSKAA